MLRFLKSRFFGHTLRITVPILIMLGTFNSTDYNMIQWLFFTEHETLGGPLLGGLVWLATIALLLWITLDSLGKAGVSILLLICGAAIYYAWELGMFTGQEVSFWQNTIPVVIGFVLGIGLIFGHFYRRLSGRVQTEDPDTE